MTKQKRTRLLKQSIRRNLFNLRKIRYSGEWIRDFYDYAPDASEQYVMELRLRRSLVCFGRHDYHKHFSKQELRG